MIVGVLRLAVFRRRHIYCRIISQQLTYGCQMRTKVLLNSFHIFDYIGKYGDARIANCLLLLRLWWRLIASSWTRRTSRWCARSSSCCWRDSRRRCRRICTLGTVSATFRTIGTLYSKPKGSLYCRLSIGTLQYCDVICPECLHMLQKLLSPNTFFTINHPIVCTVEKAAANAAAVAACANGRADE